MSEALYCEHCGSVLDRLQRRFDEQTEAIKTQAVDIARRQHTINQLRRSQRDERPPEYDDAMQVAEYWRETLHPRARELNGTRVLAVCARLKHYTKAELIKAIDGYAIKPNVGERGRCRAPEGGRRQVDLELLMRDAKRVEAGIAIYEAEMAHDQGVLNAGGSRHVAELCDCGHARISHGLHRIVGNEACYEPDCTCAGFDSLHTQAEQWLTQKGYYDAKPKKHAPPVPPDQESLL